MSSLPTTLGKYQIIREIARSNDIVYEAYDSLMNRRVALKELSMPGGSTPQQRDERVSRFKREARAAGTLAHPNIMTVYELGEDGDRYFIAMEFLDGHTLRNEIDTQGQIPIEKALEIAGEVLNGLEFAHSKGVIHRDIKPDNIQILSDNRIKLTDFGIARLTFEPNLTMDGQVFGTPSYMSPEQVVGREIDARSDLFSLAIVLYEMIGGKKPFAGDSVVSITYAIMNKEPEQLSNCNFALWQVLERALDKSPALRYSSAEEFHKALNAAKAAVSNGPVIDPIAPPTLGSYGGAYGSNPYLMPTPGQPAYSSYGASAPTPPPVLYPYNPYAASPQPGAYAPHTPGAPSLQNATAMNQNYVPNPSGLPIYYPPPPRQPLMKPETKDFLGRLILAFLIGVTLLGLVIVLIMSVSRALQSSQLQQAEKEKAYVVNSGLNKLPLDQQIKQLEGLHGSLQNESIKDEEAHLAAEKYEKRGELFFQARDYATAEQNYVRATELDPTNGVYFSDLGRVYSAVAKNEADAHQSMELWSKSVENWMNAARVERDPGKRSGFADSAARTTVTYANQLLQLGQTFDAREKLLDAKSVAPLHSQIGQRIDSLLATIDKNQTRE